MNSIEKFEIIGELYEKRYGRLRPGKSDVFHDSCNAENIKQFEEWRKSDAFDDALAEILRLQEIIKALEDAA